MSFVWESVFVTCCPASILCNTSLCSVVIAEVKEICHFFLKTLPNCYGS